MARRVPQQAMADGTWSGVLISGLQGWETHEAIAVLAVVSNSGLGVRGPGRRANRFSGLPWRARRAAMPACECRIGLTDCARRSLKTQRERR
jgi:hypothetical protein